MNDRNVRPQPRPNAISEEAGVNAVQRIFRLNGWVYQEIDGRNDFGKDAYVDLTEKDGVTGITLALQIKSGPSFRRTDGYCIPVKQHRLVWMESTVPVFGIVHDPDSDKLYWINITEFLRNEQNNNVSQIPIPSDQVLNSDTLDTDFRNAAYKAWDITQGAVFLLNLLHSSDQVQMASVYDCLALAHHEPRFIGLLRGCLKHLRSDALRAALWILGHFVPSRRLWSDGLAWIREAREPLRSNVHVDAIEVVAIMEQMEEDDWEEGQSVNELLWLITDDPDGMLKLKHALEYSLAKGLQRAANGIFEVICFLAGESGLSRYHEIATSIPGVLRLPKAQELAQHLEDHGSIYLFSFTIDDLVRNAGRISKTWPVP
jgi:hypothetical protein